MQEKMRKILNNFDVYKANIEQERRIFLDHLDNQVDTVVKWITKTIKHRNLPAYLSRTAEKKPYLESCSVDTLALWTISVLMSIWLLS